MKKIVHKTWLLDGIFHSAPGFITLEDNEFSFSLVDTGTFSGKRLNKFEAYKNLSGTFERLRKDDVVEMISIDLNNIKAKFPWYQFSGGAVLSFDGFGQAMQLSFMQPQNTKFPYHKLDNSLAQMMAAKESVDDLKAGRAFGKMFKDVLAKI